MGFHYPFKDKAAFYLRYFFSKVFCLWFEVKRPKLKMFVYEMIYSSAKLLNPRSLIPSPFKVDFVETKFGKFKVRPGTVDMSNASPAFERRDVDRLISLVDGLGALGKKVLLLDIGADIGTFTVTAGNRLKKYAGCRLMAFEPAPQSFGILKENISLNGLGGIAEAVNTALYSSDGLELDFNFNPGAPGSSGVVTSGGGTHRVKTKTLDSILEGRLSDFDILIFKMDVEGVESEILEGAKKVIASGKDIRVMVEDFVNPKIISYLERIGARFEAKLTPYNSWWRLGPLSGGSANPQK